MTDVRSKARRVSGGNADVSKTANSQFQNVASDTIDANGPFFPIEEMSSIDPSTMQGNGTWLDPLSATGGGGGGGVELENGGVPLAGGPFYTLNLVGITAVNNGGGEATLTATGVGEQRFSYVVTGSEPNLSELVITLPSPRANALYLVMVSQGTAASSLIANVDNGSRTTSQFVLTLSSDASPGDVFWFNVTDPT